MSITNAQIPNHPREETYSGTSEAYHTSEQKSNSGISALVEANSSQKAGGFDHGFELLRIEPEIEVSLSSLDFGSVLKNNSTSLSLYIRNIGGAALEVSNITVPANFNAVNLGSNSIVPGDSTEVEVTFTPDAYETYNGTLEIISNAINDPVSVTLSGEGTFVYVGDQWEQSFGVLYDRCNSVWQTSDGGFVMGGYHNGDAFDYYLAKTDANGDTIWTRTYGGNTTDVCYSVQQTSDGGYLLAGYSESYGFSNWLVKTNADGDTIWTKAIGGELEDRCFAIQQVADGYVLAGYTYSYGAGRTDVWLVKTDFSGNQIWSRTYGGPDYDQCSSVKQTADGGFILCGLHQGYGPDASPRDFLLIKTNANGDSLWSRTFGGINSDYATSVVQTTDGGFAIAGRTHSYGLGYNDMWLVKTDSNGDSLWSHTYGGLGFEDCRTVIQTADGGYVLGGTTKDFVEDDNDFYLVKTDPDGNQQWSQTFGGPNDEECSDLIITSDGSFVMAGTKSDSERLPSGFYLVKTTGCQHGELPPLEDLVVTIDQNDVLLNWTALEASVDNCVFSWTNYIVYCSETSDGPFLYQGHTPTNSYVHESIIADAEVMFYQVELYDGPPELLQQLPLSSNGVSRITRDQVHRILNENNN